MALADNKHLRRKAQPFILMQELWDILGLGIADGRQPDEMRWTLEGDLLVGSVRAASFWGMPEEAVQEAWVAWVNLVGAQPLETLDCGEGKVYLRAVREGYGFYLIRVAIEAEMPLRSQAALRGLVQERAVAAPATRETSLTSSRSR